MIVIFRVSGKIGPQARDPIFLACPIIKMQRLPLCAPISALGGLVRSSLRKAPREMSSALRADKGLIRSLQTTRPLLSVQMTVRDALNAAMVKIYSIFKFRCLSWEKEQLSCDHS